MNESHFTASEQTCHCCGKGEAKAELLELLEAIRMEHNIPIKVNCMYRCKAHNKAVGGESKSYHCGDFYGEDEKAFAADITISGITPKQVADIAEKIPGIGGIGIYKTFTHVDVGAKNRRWKG
jgi:uncharacterized protein YcbK (DUF882 family)